MKKKLKRRQGFTLIEMTIVLFIISLLILIIIPNISRARQSAQNIHGNAMVSVAQSQIDAYCEDHPDQKNVDFGTLEDNGYLTHKQKDTLDKDHIQIVREETKDNDNNNSVNLKVVKSESGGTNTNSK